MNRIDAIKQRLEAMQNFKASNWPANDCTIENWVQHSREDMAWLLERNGELLEACKVGFKALYDVIQSGFATSRNQHPADDDPDVTQLRAAIAKSEGGQE